MPTPSTTKTTIIDHPETIKIPNFDAIRLKLASPDDIHRWSHGEVLKPETVNYRTQKPEMDGLFCERIFGPSKDWECYCGKYKRVRYKGVVCDRCGVEVTRSLVRRERMGHIELATPVAHIWFTRGVPSKIAVILDIPPQQLEKVVYFASFIITKVDNKLKQQSLKELDQEFKSKQKEIEQTQEVKINQSRAKAKVQQTAPEILLKTLENLNVEGNKQTEELKQAFSAAKKELDDLKPLKIISEIVYQDLSIKYGHIFEASIGAEAIRELLEKVDLAKVSLDVNKQLVAAKGEQSKKFIRRLKVLSAFLKNNLRPEWMVLTAIPVLPPDLRPMVQLDGGRFATSDLNDLYRRVINRNNRLKRLKDLGAPEVICRNEKRMLQEAVDALIDNNARRGKTVTASTGQKRMLKSIADMLKGKQGRFRQNLLGKRVDYSGRSVIVVGPKLKLDECGLPKIMALELFRPFVISQLIKKGYVHNVRSANRFIETNRAEIWDILENITASAHVMLNRAPTLHRLGIQAFKPLLIEGKAIQLHPLVCPAFNADFDGDQMAVHIPLTREAKWEVANLMLSSKNLLKPATGEPITFPNQDIVLGCYYLTIEHEKPSKYVFSGENEAILAYENKKIKLQDPIKILYEKKILDTTVGRIIFNQVLPQKLRFVNQLMDKKSLKDLVSQCLVFYGREKTVRFLDRLMALSLKYLTRSGMTWATEDLPVLEIKKQILNEAQKNIDEISYQYNMGLLTQDEKHAKIIEIWTEAKDKITENCQKVLSENKLNPIFSMLESGARGSWGQATQMMGMKGLVTSPSGETIELPVKANFKEGFDVLEYFISTHGARKGLSDTALRTSNAGYLTRRLVDVAQDVIVRESDCGDAEGVVFTKKESEEIGRPLLDRFLGRVVLEDIKDKNGQIIIKAGVLIDEDAKKLIPPDLEKIKIRSILTCKTIFGVCQKCYGWDLGYKTLVEIGTAVGIIAAQSIGEPGTQLTMKTFHTGGVAGQDITQGLPRVEELFEVRNIKKGAILSEIAGQISKIIIKEGIKTILIEEQDKKNKKEYQVPSGLSIIIKEGDLVGLGDALTEGSLDLKNFYRLKGKEATQKYIIKDIQKIYSTQGQDLNDKHIEVILRQIFSRVYITDAGGSSFNIGEVVEQSEVLEFNNNLKKKQKPIKFETILLGITKASLTTSSFLAAASFQDTARVLINAAISGKVDYLRGLKENVIIGRLIPAGTGFRNVKFKINK